MCTRFAFFMTVEEFRLFFGVSEAAPLAPMYNIGPYTDIWIVPDASPDTLTDVQWGLVPGRFEQRSDRRPLNARAETVHQLEMFRDAFAERRCLIPANGFYEWEHRGKERIPHYVTVDDQRPFAIAGLWESWTSPAGEELRTAAMITCDSNDVVGRVHDRMPVILERDEHDAWLRGEDPDELLALLDPYPAGRTDEWEVAQRVNRVGAHDDPGLIEPVESTQTGLGEF